MCCKCCRKHSFVRSFTEQLFDISDSAGSLLNEGINVLRTFQRISAPKQFAIMFSHECVSLFKWVTNLIELLFSLFDTKPLTDFDFYTLYSLVFPISILFFISVKLKKIAYIIAYGISIGLGALASAIGTSYIFSFIPIIAFICYCGASLPIMQFLKRCCKSKVYDESIEDEEQEISGQYKFHFTYSFFATSAIFCLLLIPVAQERYTVSMLLIIFIPILLSVVFFIELVNCICFHSSFNSSIKYEAKMILFLNNILTLLIVPSTEKLISIVTVDSFYRKKWACYFTYFIINMLIPITNSIILVRGEHSSAIEKYRYTKSNCLYYLNVIDILRQIVYAFFASFDVVWGCLSVEIIWVLITIIFHPYCQVSNYFCTFLNSALIIVGNTATIISTNKTIGPLSFTKTIICFVMVCIPAIISMYIYFIFDFKTYDIQSDIEMDDITESSGNEKEYGIVEQMGIILKSFTSFAFFCYGCNIYLFDYERKE